MHDEAARGHLARGGGEKDGLVRKATGASHTLQNVPLAMSALLVQILDIPRARGNLRTHTTHRRVYRLPFVKMCACVFGCDERCVRSHVP